MGIKTLIEKVWEETNNMENFNTRYDWLKYNIRKYPIDYCRQRSKNKRIEENQIINDIQFLEGKICNEKANDHEINTYQDLKNKLEQIEEERARGFWIRSGLERIEHDEKSNSFFLNQAKTNFQKKTITSINLDSGEQITDPKDILNELKMFYQTLYKSTTDIEGDHNSQLL